MSGKKKVVAQDALFDYHDVFRPTLERFITEAYLERDGMASQSTMKLLSEAPTEEEWKALMRDAKHVATAVKNCRTVPLGSALSEWLKGIKEGNAAQKADGIVVIILLFLRFLSRHTNLVAQLREAMLPHSAKKHRSIWADIPNMGAPEGADLTLVQRGIEIVYTDQSTASKNLHVLAMGMYDEIYSDRSPALELVDLIVNCISDIIDMAESDQPVAVDAAPPPCRHESPDRSDKIPEIDLMSEAAQGTTWKEAVDAFTTAVEDDGAEDMRVEAPLIDFSEPTARHEVRSQIQTTGAPMSVKQKIMIALSQTLMEKRRMLNDT